MGTIEETLKRLQGHKVYLDTNVFIYFLDRNPDYFRLVAPHRTQTGGEISSIAAATASPTLLPAKYSSQQEESTTFILCRLPF